MSDATEALIHQSGLAAAAQLISQGIDPVLHFNCRDRNRIALLSDLLGAAALGVQSILIRRGDERVEELPVAIRPVFDYDATGLIGAARAIGDGQLPSGQVLTDGPDFFVGALAKVFSPKQAWTAKGLNAKVDAGARFLQTQPCFNPKILQRFMSRLVALKLIARVQVIVTVAVLPSASAARKLKGPRDSALVPNSVVKRLQQARDPEREGVELCAELLAELAQIPGVSGANILSLGDPSAVPEALAGSGLF